jgi:hypothetical protein
VGLKATIPIVGLGYFASEEGLLVETLVMDPVLKWVGLYMGFVLVATAMWCCFTGPVWLRDGI